MKILVATDTYPPHLNGGALATYRMVNELNKRGHTMIVLAPSTSLRNYKEKGGNITIYRLRSLFVQKEQSFRISPPIIHRGYVDKVVNEIHPDIIHIIDPGFIPVSAMISGEKLQIPIVGTIHLMPENLITHYFHLPARTVNLLSRILWIQYARIYSKLDCIISPTQAAADLLIKVKKSTKNKIEYISNGIDLEKFNKSNDGIYLKKRFRLPDVPMVLFVGRLDKEKKLDVLLRAVSYLKYKKIVFHVVITGEGKDGPRLHQLVETLGISSYMTFIGMLSAEDLPNIYKTADIFVMPGIAELQSLVTMEAMATGLPVVGADAVALPHLIKNGENGYLFKPGNSEDLAGKLKILLEDKKLREKMGAKSLDIIRVHDIRSVIPKLEDVYKRVIHERLVSPKTQRQESNFIKDLTDAWLRFFRE